MSKRIRCIVYGCTKWGYEMTGKRYESISEALKDAKFNVENDYWHSYRLVRI